MLLSLLTRHAAAAESRLRRSMANKTPLFPRAPMPPRKTSPPHAYGYSLAMLAFGFATLLVAVAARILLGH